MSSANGDGSLDVDAESMANIEEGFTFKKCDNGKENYWCAHCSYVVQSTSKAAIRRHMTTKHANVKVNDNTLPVSGVKRSADENGVESEEKRPKTQSEEPNNENVEMEDDDEMEDVIKSTQVSEDSEKTMAADDIVKFYEDMNKSLDADPDREINNANESAVIPDDTIEDIMREVNVNEEEKGEEKTGENSEENGAIISDKVDPAAELLIVKSKLNEANEKLALVEIKVEENETKLIEANTEIDDLKEKNEQFKKDIKTKDDLNEILIQEKNTNETEITGLNEKLIKYKDTMEKIFKERTTLKSLVEKQKNTISLLQNQKSGNLTDETSKETIKKLNDKIKLKNKEIEEIKDGRNRLGNELAELQNSVNRKDGADNSGKCLQLTQLVKNKTKENKALSDEIKDLKKNMGDIQKKLNESINNGVVVEERNKNLESQVQDLIEACGRNETAGRVSIDTSKNTTVFVDESSFNAKDSNQESNSKPKCKFHDKGNCHFGQNCRNFHSTSVCNTHSKWGFCENEDVCSHRHPRGVCADWKKGNCKKGLNCFYRHPEDEYASIKTTEANSFNQKRKRTFSQQSSSGARKSPRSEKNISRNAEDHFLYQKVMELQEQLNRYKSQTSSNSPPRMVPSGWTPPTWTAPPPMTTMPTMTWNPRMPTYPGEGANPAVGHLRR